MSAPKPRTYKIGQVAETTGLKSFVLRFWESEFPQLAPIRTPGGQRLYDETQLSLIIRIKSLLYDEGLTIEGARKRLADEQDGEPDAANASLHQISAPANQQTCADTQPQTHRRELLLEIQSELLSLRSFLDKS